MIRAAVTYLLRASAHFCCFQLIRPTGCFHRRCALLSDHTHFDSKGVLTLRCTRRIAAATLFLAGCVPLSAQRLTTEHAASKSAAANAPAKKSVAAAMKAIGGPAALFVENQGQFDPAVKHKLTDR